MYLYLCVCVFIYVHKKHHNDTESYSVDSTGNIVVESNEQQRAVLASTDL